MNIEKIEQNKEFFDLPIEVENGQDVFKTFFSKMKSYQEKLEDWLNEFGNKYNIINSASFIIARLKDSIELYYQGNLEGANEKIKRILEDTRKLQGKMTFISARELQSEFWFKGRIGKFYGYDRKDMLHIPYNKRFLVSNQRYSINGVPCLYLGNSIYACWEELNRPEFNSLWISRFEYNNEKLDDIIFLNLSLTIDEVIKRTKEDGRNDEEKNQIIQDYLLSWILQCACSINVKMGERDFREEYIIPQLLMQNIKNNDLNASGILYNSVKRKPNFYDSINIMKCLAIPTGDDLSFDNIVNGEITFSNKLISYFKFTEAINLGLLSTIDIKNTYVDDVPEDIVDYKISLTNNKTINYRNTLFNKGEKYLKDIEVESLEA